MGVKIDGQLAPIDAAQVEAATEGLPEEPASQEGIRPYLINWDQWYGCFSLNHEDDVFAEHNHFWDGVGHDVRLKCGSGNEYQGWGYKHIRAKHEADWQAKLNSARDAGWISEAQGVESWDDLMAAATGVAVTWPEFKGGNSISQTSCGVAEMYFWNTETGQTVYSFQLRAVWADNNDRLITSYPQHGTTC